VSRMTVKLSCSSTSIFFILLVVMWVFQLWMFTFTTGKMGHSLTMSENEVSCKTRNYKTAGNTQQQSAWPETLGEMTEQNTQTPRFDVCNDCFKLNLKPILQTKDICRPIAGETSPLFVAIITCTVGRRDVRDAIRNTWASYSRSNTAFMRYFFIVGRTNNATLQDALVLENDIFHDIVQYDFKDTYRNLTIKTMVGLQHAVKYCKTAEFVLKTDSDVYVNVPAFSHLLNSYKNTSSETGGHIGKGHNGIFGLLRKGSLPIRNTSLSFHEKWVVSKTEFPRSVYPNYLDGHAYVLPTSVARAVVDVSKNIPFFHFEDVYVGLCLEHLGYEVKDTRGFLRVNRPLTTCSHKYDYVYFVHGLNSSYMRKVWDASCPRTGKMQFWKRLQEGEWIKVNM